MAVYRVGKTFESSVLCMGEPVARKELKPGAYAWRYWGNSKHWELCRVDCRTGELFTVRELEIENRKRAR